jgi:hypothetical protein
MAPLSDKDRADLVAYLDGELDDSAARTIETKLNLDPQARAEAIALRKTWEMLDYLPRAEPSADFTQHTLQRLTVQCPPAVAEKRGWPWWSIGAGWAAAVLLAAAAGFLGANYLTRSEDPPVRITDENQNPFDRMSDGEVEKSLVQNLRVLENRKLYENVDDMEFVQKLNDPDLFGDVDVD